MLVRRALRTLQLAFDLVNPRVAIALFRTWLNGWCTARRFQDYNSSCLCQCESANSEDSIEHYAHCPVVVHFAVNKLKLPTHLTTGLRGFLCLDRDVSDEVRTLQLLLLFAVYSASNSIRFGKCPAPADISELLFQFVHQGAFNHSGSHSVVQNIWQHSRSTRARTTR